jgi:hypothetical protein
MELVLNLVGVFVAVAMVCLWLRWAPRAGVDRRTQVVALALLILILFPVISVTDDLLTALSPAETDSGLRRDQVGSGAHSTFPLAAEVPTLLLTDPSAGFLRFNAPGALPAVAVMKAPALAPIENRPPPTA